MEVFTGDSACAGCHSGAEITDNSKRILFGAVVDGVKQPAELVERMFNGQCEVVAYDQGIYNIGVRPTEEDLGQGDNDPFGNPLSFVKLLTLPPSRDSVAGTAHVSHSEHRRSANCRSVNGR